ncbi:MAG TPA: glycosyltransferase family 39 protein [Thermoanaerobaculia bacterium]|nr:glycosyltransferase family 39 protein [Thermoanaerobaculia bacterium]
MKRAELLLLGFLMLAVLAAGAAVSLHLLEAVPHVSDAIAYAFQAKIFASGRLALPPSPLPELFEQGHVIVDESRWSGKYPPGWPIILAAGFLAGAPWLVNPLLSALSLFLVWKLGRELFDSTTGLLAAALLSIAPMFVLMSGDMLAHPAALAASLATLLAVVRADKDRRKATTALAGFLAGITCLIRPFTGLTLLWPAFAWLIWRRRSLSDRLGTLGIVLAGTLPGLLGYLAYNSLLFGNPLEAGYALSNPTDGVDAFSIQAAIGNLPLWWQRLNRLSWGWPWPDLMILLPLLVPGPGRGRDLMLAGCAASLVVAHVPYFFFDIIYGGARYAFEAFGPLALLGARSLITLRDVYRRVAVRWPPKARTIAGSLLAASLGSAIAIFPLARMLSREIPYHGRIYHGVTRQTVESASQAGVGDNALVFVDAPIFHYSSFFLENELDPAGGARVYVRDIESLREAAIAAFPRREVWRIRVELTSVRGPNVYADAFSIRSVRWERLASE